MARVSKSEPAPPSSGLGESIEIEVGTDRQSLEEFHIRVRKLAKEYGVNVSDFRIEPMQKSGNDDAGD